MQLKLMSLWRLARTGSTTMAVPGAAENIHEKIVTTVAVTLGVLVVALIAMLMGLVN